MTHFKAALMYISLRKKLHYYPSSIITHKNLSTTPFITCNTCYSFSYFLFKKDFACLAVVNVMLRLHYVPGGHGSHGFGHRGRNGLTVTQRRGTGSTNVARRGRRNRRARFLNIQKICHGSHGGIDLLKCAVVERGERNKT